MHIAICIVGFRNADEIAACLGALARQTYADFDVVICENGGAAAHADLTAKVGDRLASGQPVECILASGNLGYAGGVNVCMRARPDADAWWIVNPDTEPDAGALDALVARLNQDDCAAVGGTLYHPDGKVQAFGGYWHAWLARPSSIGHGSALDDTPTREAVEARMNYLLGASMLVGRRMVDTVGLMRDDYFLYCEEVEWCLRAVATGLKLGFAPAARVQHGQGGTTGSAAEIHLRPRLPIYCDERNKIHVIRDTTPFRLPVAALSALLLTYLRYGRRRAWKQWGHALSGWLAGIRNERGLPHWMR